MNYIALYVYDGSLRKMIGCKMAESGYSGNSSSLHSGQRLECVDIAKGIAMACIIAGHLGCKEINSVVFTFHVPVFFIIAGYFFRAKRIGFASVVSRGKRLIAPYIMCGVACSVGIGVMRCFQGDPGQSWAAAVDRFVKALYGSGTLNSPILGINQFGATWFLLALFWALVAYDWICGKPFASVAVVGIFFIGILTRSWWMPLSLQAGMCALLFIHVGWLAKNRFDVNIGSIPLWLVALSAIVWVVAFVLDYGAMYLVSNYFTNIPVDVGGGIAGSVLLLWLSSLIARVPIISKGVASFGRGSLTVLCLHMFEMCVLPWGDIVSAFGIGADQWDTWESVFLRLVLKLVWAAMGLMVANRLKAFRDKGAARKCKAIAPKVRIRAYDIAKGIAIILMVVTHQVAVDPVIRKLVFSFHMPLFFLINACFIGREYQSVRTVKRSVRTLIVPYVTVCLLAAGLCGLVTPEDTKSAVMKRLVAMLGGMSKTGDVFQWLDSVWLVWFVACLFVARLVYVCLRRALQGLPPAAVPIAVFCLSFAGWWLGEHRIWLPWSVDVALYAQALMLVGDETYRRGWLSSTLPLQGMILVCGLWASLSLGGYQIEMATRSYPGYGIWCFVAACLGSWFVFAVSGHIECSSGTLSQTVGRLLEWAGRNSMVILAVHCLRMMWASWTTGSTAFTSGYDWWLNAAFEVCLCFATAYTWGRMLGWWKEARYAFIPRLSSVAAS